MLRIPWQWENTGGCWSESISWRNGVSIKQFKRNGKRKQAQNLNKSIVCKMSRLKTIDCIPVIFQRIAFNHDRQNINKPWHNGASGSHPATISSVDVFRLALRFCRCLPLLNVHFSPSDCPHIITLFGYGLLLFFLLFPKRKMYVCQSIVYEYATYLFIILNW